MVTYLFICVNSPEGHGLQIKAQSLGEARRLLFLYCAIDDPWGRIIRPEDMRKNFRVVKKTKKVTDINALLKEWGWLPWASKRA